MFNGQLKKQLEEQAAELSLLRQLRDQMGATMLSITLDTEFRMVAVNQKFAKTLGYTVEQLQGRPMTDIVPAYVKNLPCFHNFQAAVSKLAPVSDDYRFLRTDGSLAWLHIDWYPILDAHGKLLHMSGYAREVTKELQLAKENEAFINALLRSTAVIQFNLDGTVVSANDQFLQGMGYSLKQIVGKHHSMFCTPEEASSQQYKTFWQTLNRGEFVANRFKRIDSMGRDVWLEATYNPVYDTEGKLCKVVKFASVVSDQVAREEEVREAASIAYDVSRKTDTSAERGAVVVHGLARVGRAGREERTAAAIGRGDQHLVGPQGEPHGPAAGADHRLPLDGRPGGCTLGQLGHRSHRGAEHQGDDHTASTSRVSSSLSFGSPSRQATTAAWRPSARAPRASPSKTEQTRWARATSCTQASVAR